MILYDLTHPLDPSIPTWNGSCGFRPEIKMDYDQGLRVQKLELHAGVGTHMDAPSHFFKGADSISDIPLETLVVPLCVLDLSSKAKANYTITEDDIKEYEKRYGKIPAHALVIGYTGWEKFWQDPQAYRFHFPHFGEEAALLLLEREISGIAIDTLSPDPRESTFPVHKAILGAGKYIIENVANASKLPPQGALAFALPISASDCTEAPMRLIAVKL